jgi:hypothetical protein
VRVLRLALVGLPMLYLALLWASADDARSSRAADFTEPGSSLLTAPLEGPEVTSLSLQSDASHWRVRTDLWLPGHEDDVLREALRLEVMGVGLEPRSRRSDDVDVQAARSDLAGRTGSILVATNVPEPSTAWLVLIGLGILSVPRFRVHPSKLRE